MLRAAEPSKGVGPSRLSMLQARFQAQQMAEKEEKLIQILEQRQDEQIRRVLHNQRNQSATPRDEGSLSSSATSSSGDPTLASASRHPPLSSSKPVRRSSRPPPSKLPPTSSKPPFTASKSASTALPRTNNASVQRSSSIHRQRSSMGDVVQGWDKSYPLKPVVTGDNMYIYKKKNSNSNSRYGGNYGPRRVNSSHPRRGFSLDRNRNATMSQSFHQRPSVYQDSSNESGYSTSTSLMNRARSHHQLASSSGEDSYGRHVDSIDDYDDEHYSTPNSNDGLIRLNKVNNRMGKTGLDEKLNSYSSSSTSSDKWLGERHEQVFIDEEDQYRRNTSRNRNGNRNGFRRQASPSPMRGSQGRHVSRRGIDESESLSKLSSATKEEVERRRLQAEMRRREQELLDKIRAQQRELESVKQQKSKVERQLYRRSNDDFDHLINTDDDEAQRQLEEEHELRVRQQEERRRRQEEERRRQREETRRRQLEQQEERRRQLQEERQRQQEERERRQRVDEEKRRREQEEREQLRREREQRRREEQEEREQRRREEQEERERLRKERLETSSNPIRKLDRTEEQTRLPHSMATDEEETATINSSPFKRQSLLRNGSRLRTRDSVSNLKDFNNNDENVSIKESGKSSNNWRTNGPVRSGEDQLASRKSSNSRTSEVLANRSQPRSKRVDGSSSSTFRKSVLAPRDDLRECTHCGRRFAEDRIDKHQSICARTTSKKRKTFDASKKRIQGTEAELFHKRNKRSNRRGPEVAATAKKSDWRRKREEFISALRAAKEAQRHLAKGGKISDLPPPPPLDTSDYVPCPHCGRRFNEAAADRHIPKCKNIKSNKR